MEKPEILPKNLLHPIKIGSGATISGNIFLAPMAGFTDAAFRHICIEYGSDLCYTEMVSSEALARKSFKTKKILYKAENETNYAVQIFSSSWESAVASLKDIIDFKPLFIDLNCGCPVPKIMKSGAGSALMKNPDKIGEIVKALTEATDIPITVKLRSGLDSENINFMKAAEIAVKNHAAMVCLHPRTKTQGYSGKSDWLKIKELKNSIDVPVIGSGDLFEPQDCLNMLKETGCDGVMIARGAVGRPQIFKEVKFLAKTGVLPEISFEEKINAAINHLDLAEKYIGSEIAVKEMKKHLCSYIKGIKGGALIRNRIVHCNFMDEYKAILNELMK
ncbi:MAG: tRNA dihydrouridine synthase DusB [Spirochaetaceae bacterium]|nr:tRNA dihydrouridine synthase DusB [Spirochaetaceae bacterium]